MESLGYASELPHTQAPISSHTVTPVASGSSENVEVSGTDQAYSACRCATLRAS